MPAPKQSAPQHPAAAQPPSHTAPAPHVPSALPYNPPPPPPPPPAGAAVPTGSLDIGRSFSFAFQDSDWWKKCLVLGLISLIPIVGWFVLVGYYIEVAKRSASGSDLPLPDIDFGGHLSVGFSYFLAFFCFGLAAMAVVMVIYLPLMFLGKMPGIGVVFGVLGSLVAFVFYVVMYLYMFAGQAVSIMEDNPWAIFQVKRILPGLKANLLNCFLVLLLLMAYGIIGYAGLIACGVGILISFPLSMLMFGNILGQLGKILKKSGV